MKYRAKTLRLGRLRLSIALWAANPHPPEGWTLDSPKIAGASVLSANLGARAVGPEKIT